METRAQSMTFDLANELEVTGVRVIDASRDVVWRAHTDCAVVKEWMVSPDGDGMNEGWAQSYDRLDDYLSRAGR